MEENDTLLMTPLKSEVRNSDCPVKDELFAVAKVPNIADEIDDEVEQDNTAEFSQEADFSEDASVTETIPPADEEPSQPTTILIHNSATYGSRSSSASTINVDVCRICHCESEPDAPLISPCVCSGSLKFVHQACLQQWIKSADTKSCELCKYDYSMTTKIKPFRKWQKLDLPTTDRRKLMCSVTFHFVAITCVIWALYVLIEKATQEIHSGMLEWPFWTKLIVVAIGFTGGLVFMYVQCKMYVQLCRRWRAYNRVIYIQNVADLNQKVSVQPVYTPTKSSHVIGMQPL